MHLTFHSLFLSLVKCLQESIWGGQALWQDLSARIFLASSSLWLTAIYQLHLYLMVRLERWNFPLCICPEDYLLLFNVWGLFWRCGDVQLEMLFSGLLRDGLLLKLVSLCLHYCSSSTHQRPLESQLLLPEIVKGESKKFNLLINFWTQIAKLKEGFTKERAGLCPALSAQAVQVFVPWNLQISSWRRG